MCIRFASRNCNDGAGAHGRFGGGAVKPYYEHAGITIYHGDCREILPTLPKFDLLLTDPPYGYAYASDYVCETTTADWMQQEIANDGDTSARDEILALEWFSWAVFASWKRPFP